MTALWAVSSSCEQADFKASLMVHGGYLVLEVSVVLENSPLVSPCPNIVLHHVLLLGEVAIKLVTSKKIKKNSLRELKYLDIL